MAHGQGGAEIGFDRGPTLTRNYEAPIAAYPATTHTLRGEGFDASEDGTGRGAPLGPMFLHANKGRPAGRQSAHTEMVSVKPIVETLTTDGHAQSAVAVPVAFHPTQYPISSTDGSTHALGCGSTGGQASEDGTGRGTPLVPCVVGAMSASGGTQKKHGFGWGQQDWENGYCVPVALDTTQITSPQNVSNPKPGDACHPPAAGAHAPAIAFPANLSGTQCASTEELAPSMGAANPTAVAFGVTIHGTHPTVQKIASYDEIAQCLRARAPGNIDNSSTSVVMQPVADANSPPPAVFYPVRYGYHQQDTLHHEAGIMSTLPSGSNNNVGHYTATVQAMQVRRLTPRECERLQGFQFRVPPDYPGAWEDAPGEWWSPDYTLTPGKARKINPDKLDRDYVKYLARGGRMTFEQCCNAAADGPRYKALGNSWAVPNVRWIGERIQRHLAGEL